MGTYRRGAGLWRALTLAVAAGVSLARAAGAESWFGGGFDLQAHRGGMGLRSESPLSSFGDRVQVGVSTLEPDVRITADGVAVVIHDRQISPRTRQDTGPALCGDHEELTKVAKRNVPR